MKRLTSNMVAIFMVFIVILVIIPLPVQALDFMFMISIAVSLLIMLMSMYVKDVLEIAIFPTLMLITTVFRLALTISSTRLILINGGNAGKMVKTFGEFVIGGSLAVGFVIFLIIVFVNFMVITKGAERVAEVTARFTLDAMPGKQMAIDADLNAGTIDEQEAKFRRLKIQREADFYGSMDGAVKFVKGDAIASIVITIINFVGGILVGLVQGNMDFGTVLNVYTIATVGDGLVSQVPSLLISVATAMIVTRANSDNNLNMDVAKQMLSQPTALIISGIAVMCMAFIPGAPTFQIMLVGGGLIVLGAVITRSQAKAPLVAAGVGGTITMDPSAVGEDDSMETINEVSFYRDIDNVYTLLNVDPIEMEFGYSLVPLVDESSGGSFVDRIVMFRKQFATEYGLVIPTVRLRDNGMLNPNQYVIKLKGEEIGRGEILVDYYLALDPGGVSDEIEGIDTIEPAYGIPSKWIVEDLRETAEIYGYTVIDPLSVIITHLSELVRKNAHELLSRQDVNSLLEHTSKYNPSIVADIVPGIISVGELQKILANLLRESVPIRDMESILETIGDYGAQIKDPDILTEYIRQKLRRTITRQHISGNAIKVITIDQEIEHAIMQSIKKGENGTYLAMEPDKIQGIVNGVMQSIDSIRDIVQSPLVLTSPVVRVYLKKMLDQFNPDITVISFAEIDPSVQIQALANVTA